MELVSPTAAHRIRIAVALVLLDSVPSHLSISEYISQLKDELQAARVGRITSSEVDLKEQQLERTTSARVQRVSGGSFAGREVLGSTNSFSVASPSLGLLAGDDFFAPTDSEALRLAHKISPFASQIVSLLLQSPVTSPSVVSELLKLVSMSLENREIIKDGHGSSAGSATEQKEAILGAARLSMWIVERVARSGVADSGVEGILRDLLSSFIEILCCTSSRPAYTLPLLISHAFTHLPKPIVSSRLPTLVEQALSSFVALVQSLSAGVQEPEEVQQRLLSLSKALDLVVNQDEAGSVSTKAKEGLTRIIAEFGVSELVGVEVEGAVLALLEDFEVEQE